VIFARFSRLTGFLFLNNLGNLFNLIKIPVQTKKTKHQTFSFIFRKLSCIDTNFSRSLATISGETVNFPTPL
jgi:hypothetical protein